MANSDSSATIGETVSAQKFVPTIFNHNLYVKLNENSFLIWKQQMLGAIRGHKHLKFIEDDENRPPKFLSQNDRIQRVVNPDYVDWDQQDQLLFSWLLSSMSQSILTRLVGCETSAQIWKILEVYFTTNTQARVSQLKNQLQNTKKGSSMTHNHQNRQHASYRSDKQHASYIPDKFTSLDQVISELRDAGLESSNLIVSIDFTKSNEWTGKYSFNRRSLHAIGSTPNPYEQAISIIGRTLSPFDEDNLIPCFGFGDASTHDKYVFSFFSDQRYCRGFEEVLARYREIVPHLKLAGPTSFAPIIDASIDIVEKSGDQYHVLVIIADGQVTRNPNTPPGRLSLQEQETIDSIVAASHFPLSIILVGVGDGPWDDMHRFDDNIPNRNFDNFQFVNFTKIMKENNNASKKETAFALAALMEIPFQYKATQNLRTKENDYRGLPRASALPPPPEVIDHDKAVGIYPHMKSFESVEHAAATSMEQACPICLTNPRDMAFGCGHMTCKECGVTLSACPMCREPITTRLKLFS